MLTDKCTCCNCSTPKTDELHSDVQLVLSKIAKLDGGLEIIAKLAVSELQTIHGIIEGIMNKER